MNSKEFYKTVLTFASKIISIMFLFLATRWKQRDGDRKIYRQSDRLTHRATETKIEKKMTETKIYKKRQKQKVIFYSKSDRLTHRATETETEKKDIDKETETERYKIDNQTVTYS